MTPQVNGRGQRGANANPASTTTGMELNGASESERRVVVRQVDAHLQLSLRIPRNENMEDSNCDCHTSCDLTASVKYNNMCCIITQKINTKDPEPLHKSARSRYTMGEIKRVREIEAGIDERDREVVLENKLPQLHIPVTPVAIVMLNMFLSCITLLPISQNSL